MENQRKSRDRDQNFSNEEVEFLVECVKERIDIIENKKTDSKAVYSKNIAWSQIEDAFIENPDVKNRNKDQLAIRWKNLKTVSLHSYLKQQKQTKA